MKSFSSRQTSGRGVARQGGRRLFAPGAAARPRDRHTRASLGVVDLEARPGPAAAHQHRGQAFWALRRPPRRRRLVADVWRVDSLSGQALPPSQKFRT